MHVIARKSRKIKTEQWKEENPSHLKCLALERTHSDLSFYLFSYIFLTKIASHDAMMLCYMYTYAHVYVHTHTHTHICTYNGKSAYYYLRLLRWPEWQSGEQTVWCRHLDSSFTHDAAQQLGSSLPSLRLLPTELLNPPMRFPTPRVAPLAWGDIAQTCLSSPGCLWT